MHTKLVILFSIIISTSCHKKNDACMPVSAASESEQLAAFCTKNFISYTVDENGVYYQVIDQGSGIRPGPGSVITVAYTAATLDGNVVEDYVNQPVTSTLDQFIECWRIALPYIQKGGHLKMVVPSSLAYGCTGVTSKNISPNAPLYYDIVLMDVQ